MTAAASAVAPVRDGPSRGLVVLLLLLVMSIPMAVVAVQRPAMVIPGMVGLAALAICMLRVDIALLALVATIPLESAFRISSNEQLSASKAVGAICFASFAVHAIATRLRIRLDRTHALLLLLLAVALISSSEAMSFSNGLTVTLRYASFVGLYIVVTQLAHDPQLLRKLIWVLSLGSGMAAALAVSNFLLGDALLATPAHGNANDLAFVLATTVPLTAWLLLEAHGVDRLVPGLLIALMSTAIALAFSRGALLGLGLGLLWHALTERRHIKLLVGASLIAVVSALLLVQTSPAAVATGLQAKSNIADQNVETRLDAWSAALELAADHPILGIGPGNFGLYYYELTDTPPGAFRLDVSHDAYLDVAAELGFTGLILFVSYLLVSFARLGRAVREGSGPPGLAALTRTSLVVVTLGFLTHSQQYLAPVWLLGALGTAIWRGGQARPSASSR